MQAHESVSEGLTAISGVFEAQVVVAVYMTAER